MDVTVQAVFITPNHNSKNAKYLQGDIVGIHPLIKDTPSKTGRLCLVHIIGAPDSINMQNVLTEFVRVEMIDEVLTSKSAWQINLIDMDNLEGLREQSITWEQSRLLFTRKADGITGGEYYESLD